MSAVFMGTYYNSIDAKNRMIIPSRFRDKMDGVCILTKGIDSCLEIYSTEEWERLEDKIAKLPESDPAVRSFIRHFFANAAECTFDKQGRIVIPSELIRYAQIQKELVTMGAMRKIEVWSREVWETPDNEGRMDYDAFAEALKKYNF